MYEAVVCNQCIYCNERAPSHCARFLPSYLPGPDAQVDLPLQDLSKVESQSAPSAAAVQQDFLLAPEQAVKTEEEETETETETETREPLKNNLTEDRELQVMDAHEEGARTEGRGPVSLKHSQ